MMHCCSTMPNTLRLCIYRLTPYIFVHRKIYTPFRLRFPMRNSAACAKNAKPLLASCVMGGGDVPPIRIIKFCPTGVWYRYNRGRTAAGTTILITVLITGLIRSSQMYFFSFLMTITSYSTRTGYNHSHETWPAVSSPVTV